MFKSTVSFCSSKALKYVLNVLTLKVPTLTRRCFMQFTTLRLATDSEEVMVSRARLTGIASLLLTPLRTMFVCDHPPSEGGGSVSAKLNE